MAMITAGGAVAEKVWGNNTLLTTVALNQRSVMNSQDAMKGEIRDIKQVQVEMQASLQQHNEEAKLVALRITTLHHQRGIKNCDDCHDKRGNLMGPSAR